MTNPYTITKNDYTAKDAGCWVDGARGIYCIDAIVAIAETHDMGIPNDCGDEICSRCFGEEHEAGDGSYTEWSHCFHVSEIEDECDTYMNECFPVEGHYWGRSEQGDWGLWESEE